MIAIGSVRIDTNVIMAPLAGVSDLSLRLIVREHGARCCFYEMVDVNSIVRAKSRKSREILKVHPADTPVAAQILGDDPAMMLDAAQVIVEKARPVFLDVNAACPMKKVVRRKSGAYLLVNRDNLFVTIKNSHPHSRCPSP